MALRCFEVKETALRRHQPPEQSDPHEQRGEEGAVKETAVEKQDQQDQQHWMEGWVFLRRDLAEIMRSFESSSDSSTVRHEKT